MNIYTVMLLYPDYAFNRFGHEQFTEVAEAETVKEAVEKVRKSACEANTHVQYGCSIQDPADFAVIAVMRGTVEFLTEDDV